MKFTAPALLIAAATLAPAPLLAQSVDQRAEPMPSFASLFRDLPGDFRQLVTPGSAMILGAGGGLSAAIHPRDRQLVNDTMHARTLEESLDPGQLIGDGYVQAGAAMATYLLGRASHNTRVATIGAELVRAQIITETLTEGLKVSVNRTRPDGTHLSFPSGHTAASFATASVLQRELGWKVGMAAYAFAGYVGVSRMSENKHFASDVAFGAAIGILAGRAVTIRRGHHAFSLSPFAAPGGGGVGVTMSTVH
jgi:hypothetical protein